MEPLAPALLAAHALVVEADRIEIDGGEVRAEGDVVVVEGDRVATAGVLAADVALSRISLVDASWTPCGCGRPAPYGVTARSAEWLPGDSVRLRGAWARLLGVPILPVHPVRLPLAPAPGPRLPEIGHGVHGFTLALPVTVARWPDAARLTLAPEIRTARSLRLLGTVRSERDSADGALGWDFASSRLRGGASWDVRGVSRTGFPLPIGLASEGFWSGDADYAREYGDRFLDRGRPYDEIRALVTAGPAEIALAGYRHAGDVAQPLAAASLNAPSRDLPHGFVLSGAARAGLVGRGETPLGVDSRRAEAVASVRVERPFGVGPLRLAPSAGLGGLAAEQGTASWGALGLDARLPAWRVGEGSLDHLEPGVRVEVARRARAGAEDNASGSLPGTPSPAPGTAFARPDAWSIEPDLLVRRTGARGLLVEGRARGRIARSGLAASADGRLSVGRLSAWMQGRVGAPQGDRAGDSDGEGDLPERFACAAVAWAPGSQRVELGWIYGDPATFRQPNPLSPAPLHQVRASVDLTPPGRLSVLSLGLATSADLEARAPVTREARLTWTHPTGCASLGAIVRQEADRGVPEFGLRISTGR